MQKQKNLLVLVECAIMIALAAVLSTVKIYEAPLGGSITLFSMVPIIIIGLRHGPAWGFASAFVYAITQWLFGMGTVGYVPTAQGAILCVIYDYIIAFTIIGTAGLFKPLADNTPKRGKKIIIAGAASLTACVLRYIFHVISGAVVWYEITKEGNWNEYVHTVGMWTYSIVYNLQYMLPETIITIVAAPAIITILSIVNKQRRTV